MRIQKKKIDEFLSNEFHLVRSRLHRKTGVYLIYDHDQVEYVGMSINLAARCLSSVEERGLSRCPTVIVSFMLTENAADASVLELCIIAALQPPRNGQKFGGAFTGQVSVPHEVIEPTKVFDDCLLYELIEEEREERYWELPKEYAPETEPQDITAEMPEGW